MKRVAALCLACCLLFCGCANMFDGSYVSVTPHKGQTSRPISQTFSARNYSQLCQVLKDIFHSGTTESLITLANYNQVTFEREDMERALQTILKEDPIAAYAVDSVSFDLITSQGQPAVLMAVSFSHDRTEIQKIQKVEDETAAKAVIAAELSRYSTGFVLHVKNADSWDYAQWVEDYGALHPETVMEVPTVTVNLYPQEATEQVVELKFNYQHSRDSIREMQTKVEPIFAAAELYISGSNGEREKYAQLYAFLIERFESYTLQTSITPAYSLLMYGVGDSRAFANVYGAMCRRAGIECITISGTRWGEAWHWNLVEVGGVYYHLDLLGSHRNGAFRLYTDEQMAGYVWNYAEYPASATS